MHEYKEGKLHSGSKKGPKVKNPKQAVAIAYSEERRKASQDESKGSKSKTGEKPDKNTKYPTLEFVGKVRSTDLENGKKKPAKEHESEFAEKIALKEARKAGVKEKKRVNYFPKTSNKKRK